MSSGWDPGWVDLGPVWSQYTAAPTGSGPERLERSWDPDLRRLSADRPSDTRAHRRTARCPGRDRTGVGVTGLSF